jgi:hypothetical protein
VVRDLYWSGKEMNLGEAEWVSFFENVVYREADFVFEDGKLVFVRGDIGKVGILSAGGGNDEIKFDVDYVFEFGREYRVIKSGDDYVLEVVG